MKPRAIAVRSFLLVFHLAGAMLVAEESAYEPPRTATGRPDFSGVWTNASLTRLSRPDDIETLVLDPARAAELSGRHFHNVRAARDLEPSDPDREAPSEVDQLPPIGNYNAGWVDPGSDYAVVKGEIRSSWLVEPADGKVPYRPELRERLAASRARRRRLEGPEVVSLGERCLLGFGGTAGPPMLNVLYNNYFRFLQTEEHLMILIEMVHDARSISIDRGPRAGVDEKVHEGVPRWLGESHARWEADTLVIETTNFHPGRARYGPLYYSARALVEERLTRVSDDALHYAFRIEDPTNYSEPMRGEMTFRAAQERVFEYACHEGNYAMSGILRGARLKESERTGGE